MDFGFRKKDNTALFRAMSGAGGLNLRDLQNYLPLYEKFFDVTKSNFNTFNLKNPMDLIELGEKNEDGSFKGRLCNQKGGECFRNVFFKLSPILDPIRYMVGKYDVSDEHLMKLPTFGVHNSHAKSRDPNNSAYVDGLFSHLTGHLLHSHKFPHGLDFFGSYLGTKVNMEINVADDLEYLHESEFFHKKRGVLFEVADDSIQAMFGSDTRNKRERLGIVGESIDLDDITDVSTLDDALCDVFVAPQNVASDDGMMGEADMSVQSDDESLEIKPDDDSDTCSSRSSVTSGSDDEEEDEDEDDEGSMTGSDWSEESVYMGATIPEFPVHVIALEKCDQTFEDLINCGDEELPAKEWASAVFQILMTLAYYQKSFGFTHNDLHASNIMYVPTDRAYLTYKYGGKYYRVPTFGRMFKLIDFGRAIYKFRGTIVCSDSYHHRGDAAGQYNFGPYFDERKPRLEPSFGFDLCRLGCALYDTVIDNVEEGCDETSIYNIVASWCLDDQGRNLLYKSNGEERYPGFKLYKMIARHARVNTTPEVVMRNPFFERYNVSRKSFNKRTQVINIDEAPVYTD